MILETLLTGRIIAFNVKLVWITGSVNAALLLSQLCYWSDKGDMRNFFYKTINEIQDETGLSRYEQDGALKLLVSKKLVAYELGGVPPKRYFSVQWEAIGKALRDTENKRPVQISEKQKINLHKLRSKKAQKKAGFTENQISEKEKIELLCDRKFHIDYNIDDKIEKEREEKIFSEQEINDFVLFLCSSEKVRSPVAYEATIREKIANSHKATLLALADFLAKQEAKKALSEYEVLSNLYYGRDFNHGGVAYVFHKVGLCSCDVRFGNELLERDSVFLELWLNGDSRSLKLFVFDNLESVKKYLEGVL